MDRDEILRTYDDWYRDTYEDRFSEGDPWRDSLFGYKLDVVRELLPDQGRWLDLGCGTGRLLGRFPDVDREGLDLSPSMLSMAQSANPGTTFHEGSFWAPRPEWQGSWDLLTNLWMAYQYADSLKQLEEGIGSWASWLKPDGSLVIHVADSEDIARGLQLPWEDADTPVFGHLTYLTGIVWTWQETNGRIHDLVAPQLQHLVNVFGRHFEEVEVRRWPAIAPGWLRPKAIIGHRPLAQPRTREEVGYHHPYRVTFPPRDHPLEGDPWRPGDDPGELGPAGALAPTIAAAPFGGSRDDDSLGHSVDALAAQVGALRDELSQVRDLLVRPDGQGVRQYDIVGVMHDQVGGIRRELAELSDRIFSSGVVVRGTGSVAGQRPATVASKLKQMARRVTERS